MEMWSDLEDTKVVGVGFVVAGVAGASWIHTTKPNLKVNDIHYSLTPPIHADLLSVLIMYAIKLFNIISHTVGDIFNS